MSAPVADANNMQIIPYGPFLPTTVPEWEMYVAAKKSQEHTEQLLTKTMAAADDARRIEQEHKVAMQFCIARKRKNEEAAAELRKEVKRQNTQIAHIERQWK